MGRWRDWLLGPKEETRAITSLPWGSPAPFDVGPGRYDSDADALSLGSVYSALSLLGSTISTLPLDAGRKIGDARVPMSSLPQLFGQLAADGRLVPWLHQCVVSVASRGNAVGYIIARDGFGFPTVVEWLDLCEVTYDDAAREWRWRGRVVPDEDIVHIPWFTVPGKRMALSPIASYAATLGIGLGAQSYARDWFDGGGFPPGTFRNTEQVIPNADEANAIRAKLAASRRTRQPMVYGKDWEYTPISVPPEEAQFVQTMKMTATQVAAIYHIPPEKIGGETGHSLTYATAETHQIEWTTDALRTWLEMLEAAFTSWLPDRQYVKFNINGLVRADMKTRYESYAIGLQNGWLNRDEVRAYEDLEPLPNGEGQTFAVPPPATPALTAADKTSNGDVVPMRRPG
jgi:HK97 family phage portal protein